jgi:hypothetical protein
MTFFPSLDRMAEDWELRRLERQIEPLERRVGDLEKANRKRQDFWYSLLFWAMMAVLWAEIGASIALAATGRHH